MKILRWLAAPLGGLLLAMLAACNGTAVVTLTSTPSTDTFLAYRVGLVAVQLRTSSGSSSVNVLPAGTTVDLARLVNLSEVIGSSSGKTGTFKQAVVTLDYSSAQIIYDNGTPEGVQLTPMGASGQALGRVTLTLLLDPSSELSIAAKSTTRLSLNFNLAASNVVNLSAKTVSVMPMMAASSLPIDDKTVRIRGPIGAVSTGTTNGTYSASIAPNSWYSTGITPFDFSTAEGGSLRVTPTTGTTYEINGTPVSGTAGLTQLASLSAGTMVEAFGTMTTSTSTSNSLFNDNNVGTPTETCSDGTVPQTVNSVLTCTDGSTLESTSTTSGTETCSDGTVPETLNGVLTCTDGSTLESTNTGTTSTGTITTVSFSATQVIAGSSLQAGGFDRVSGVVTGRSGNTFTIDDATLLTNAGTNTLVFGTTTVTVGPNTQITEFGESTPDSTGIAQISIGSLVYAFGTAGTTGATLDASAGRVRVGQTTASGLVVTAEGTSGTTLTLNLAQLGGRSAAAFDFAGTGSTSGNDATAAAYIVNTGTADLTNASVGEPVQVTGYPAPFGSASSTGDFLQQSAFLDYTTINAVLVLDWTGTSAPFASLTTSQIQLDVKNAGIGTRHTIQVGAQSFSIIGIGTDPTIIPSASSSNTVFTIGHSVSGSYENFNTFSSFVTQLQTELAGSVIATGMTAFGQYTSSSYQFSASSITIFLDN